MNEMEWGLYRTGVVIGHMETVGFYTLGWVELAEAFGALINDDLRTYCILRAISTLTASYETTKQTLLRAHLIQNVLSRLLTRLSSITSTALMSWCIGLSDLERTFAASVSRVRNIQFTVTFLII